jgi:hypothetical protein
METNCCNRIQDTIGLQKCSIEPSANHAESVAASSSTPPAGKTSDRGEGISRL